MISHVISFEPHEAAVILGQAALRKYEIIKTFNVFICSLSGYGMPSNETFLECKTHTHTHKVAHKYTHTALLACCQGRVSSP